MSRVVKIKGDKVETGEIAAQHTKVDAVLAIDKLSLNYRVELSPNEALKWAHRAEAYNDFTQLDIIRLIQSVNSRIPPMSFGHGNPNNGKAHHKFLVGNENSRVIYVDIAKFYLRTYAETAYELACANPGNNLSPQTITLEDYADKYYYPSLIDSLKRAAHDANADEITHEVSSGGILLRFWWD